MNITTHRTTKLMREKKYTPAEKDFLAFLMEITDGGKKPCYRSNAWIAEQIGVSENTVDNILQSLRNEAIPFEHPKYQREKEYYLLLADKNDYKEREIKFTGAKAMVQHGYLVFPQKNKD